MNRADRHEKYLVHFGAMAAEARQSIGKSEETVAHALGISQATLSKIENGKYYSLNINTIIDFSHYFQIPIADLLPPPQYSIINYSFVNNLFLTGINAGIHLLYS